jgi:hypothetical protein
LGEAGEGNLWPCRPGERTTRRSLAGKRKIVSLRFFLIIDRKIFFHVSCHYRSCPPHISCLQCM